MRAHEGAGSRVLELRTPLGTRPPSFTSSITASFGACPRDVLAAQDRWRARMEAQPVPVSCPRSRGSARRGTLDARRVSRRRARQPRLGEQRDRRRECACCAPARSARETSCWRRTTRTTRAATCSISSPTQSGCASSSRPCSFPLASSEEAVDSILACVGTRTPLRAHRPRHEPDRTRAADRAHRALSLAARGVDVMVDGAHAPGMVEVDLARLGAMYYAGNCHRCGAPKGRGFLYVRPTSSRKCGRSPSAMAPTRRAAIARVF